MTDPGRFFLLVAAMTASACGQDVTPDVGCVTGKAVYGMDGRVEVSAAPEAWRSLSARAVALVPTKTFLAVVAHPNDLASYVATDSVGLCADEPFANEVSLADCSGFLLSEDLVLTAGHCIVEDRCDEYTYVTGFDADAKGQVSLSAAQGRECARVEARDSESGDDFALVRLAAPFHSLPPFSVRRDLPQMHEAVFLLGYSVGLPLKLHGGGVVVWSDGSSRFGTDIDAFGGDSGGPVFDASGDLIGVMREGQLDFVRDEAAGCLRSKVVSAEPDAGLYESVGAIGPILEKACALGVSAACDLPGPLGAEQSSCL